MLHEYPLLFLVRIKCKEEIFFYLGMWYNKIKIWKNKEETMRLLFNMETIMTKTDGRLFVTPLDALPSKMAGWRWYTA